MFFIISKILSFLTSPLNLVVLAILFGLYIYKKKQQTKVLKWSLLTFYFLSNGFISNQLIKLLEQPPVEISSLEKHDVGIVLSGITQVDSRLHDRISYTQGVNRLYHGFLLYKRGKIDKILVTGGNGRVLSDNIGEADQLAQTLLEWGVKKEDIIIENKAQNTHQNARNSIALLNKNEAAIIITSSFHMHRSEMCFKKLGKSYTPFPTDYYSTKTIYSLQHFFFPNIAAFRRWNIIAHEVIGIAMYKVSGYI